MRYSANAGLPIAELEPAIAGQRFSIRVPPPSLVTTLAQTQFLSYRASMFRATSLALVAVAGLAVVPLAVGRSGVGSSAVLGSRTSFP